MSLRLAGWVHRQRMHRSSSVPRETLANLSITGHLRCLSDQPVAEMVQCGEPISCFAPIRKHVERLNVAGRKTPRSKVEFDTTVFTRCACWRGFFVTYDE